MNTDLIKIKKYYGENMMHLCRELFPTLLEQENLLFTLIDSNFAHSKYLYDDIIENNMIEQFKNYIYSLIDVEKEEIEVIKTPKELLDEAGYILYECKTEEDIQKFKKYYAKHEELCTFNGGRLDNCYVFFAVKKNVDEIKRENFDNPTRQDEYGTSVISIQFSKKYFNTLSIKNRYNHKVNNPDATFSNNLENIIEGLTRSFEKEYNLNINQNNKNGIDLPNYVKANDGKFYKYNYEINNIYYCPNNIIVDNFEVILDFQEKEKYIVLDYFVLDLVNKEIFIYDRAVQDGFNDRFQNIKKIEITKENKNKLIKLIFDDDTFTLIEIDKYNRIVKYEDKSITTIDNFFLPYNKTLEEINIPNVKKIGIGFLHDNEKLESLNLPSVVRISNNFLYSNKKLKELIIPNIERIGHNFLYSNRKLKKLDLPNVREIYSGFLYHNVVLDEINIPKVIFIGESFLEDNRELKKIDIPTVEIIGKDFLCNNEDLEEIKLEKVREIGFGFLIMNKKLRKLYLPNVEKVGMMFLPLNTQMEKLYLPKIEKIHYGFLENNRNLKEIYVPDELYDKLPKHLQIQPKNKILKK